MKKKFPIKALFAVIINREFTWFIIARILFIAGLRMTPVLLGWRLYEITGSKLALGILGLSEVIPAIGIALPAGVRVDKSDKHKLLRLCIAFYFLLMLGLMVCYFSLDGKKYIRYCSGMGYLWIGIRNRICEGLQQCSF